MNVLDTGWVKTIEVIKLTKILNKMKDFKDIAVAIGLRILIAAPIFAAGCYLIAAPKYGTSSFQQIFLALGCFLISIVIVTPSIVRLFAEPAGSLYHSEKEDVPRAPPDYSVPEKLRARGLFEEAMTAYEKIALQHPQASRPFLEMLDIALIELDNRDRAEAILNKGLALLSDPQNQEALRIAFATTTSSFSKIKI